MAEPDEGDGAAGVAELAEGLAAGETTAAWATVPVLPGRTRPTATANPAVATTAAIAVPRVSLLSRACPELRRSRARFVSWSMLRLCPTGLVSDWERPELWL